MEHLPPMALLLPGVIPAGVYGRACRTLPGLPAPVNGAWMNLHIFNPLNPQKPIV